jgi:hypothetical protein
LNFNAGAGNNSLTLARGSARIDSTAIGGTLNTTVGEGAHLSTNRLSQNDLSIAENGRVNLLPFGQASVITDLTIGSGVTLDIGNGRLVLDYTGASPLAAVRERILSGRGGAGFGMSWNGTGMTSSAAAAANAAAPETWSVGYAENAALPLGAYATFGGVAIDDTAVLIAYARTGDANLDGAVNDDDVTVVGATYAPGVAGASWAAGDFDYSGFVDDDDVTLLGSFYDPSAEPAVAPLAPVEARSAVEAWSADFATTITEGHSGIGTAGETFGPTDVRGQETRARQVVRDERSGADSKAIDLVAESIARESYDSDRLATSTRRAGRRLAAIDAMWANWG